MFKETLKEIYSKEQQGPGHLNVKLLFEKIKYFLK